MDKKKKIISEAKKAEAEKKNRECEEREKWEDDLWQKSIVHFEMTYLGNEGHRLVLFLIRDDGDLSVVFHFEEYDGGSHPDDDEYSIDFSIPVGYARALAKFLREPTIKDWTHYNAMGFDCRGYGYKCDTNGLVRWISLDRYRDSIVSRLRDMNHGQKLEHRYDPGPNVLGHLVCICGWDEGVLVHDTELANGLDVLMEMEDSIRDSIDNLKHAITGYNRVDGGILGRLDDIESAIGSTASGIEDVAKQIQKRGEF